MPGSPTPTRAYDLFRRTKYFGALDGLRCMSILAVMWHHCVPHPTGLREQGGLGVQLFFAISGFLITTLLLREQSDRGQISLKSFYIRRTLRIFPLYYTVIGLFIVSVLLMERDPSSPTGLTVPGTEFFHNLRYFLTYTSNWFVPPQPGKRIILILAWSLATEEQFYLVWPPIVRFFSRAWIVPVAFMSAMILVNALRDRATQAEWIEPDGLPRAIINTIAPAICMGCLLAILLHNPRGFAFAYRVLGQAWSAPIWIAAMFACAIWRTAPELMTYFTMAMTVAAVCIRPDHLLAGVLGNRVVAYVGTVSYGLYLLHMFAVQAARRLIPHYEDRPLLTFAAVLGLSLMLASASYWLYERRFLALKARLGGHAAPLPAPPALGVLSTRT